jgi:hypothetical protein
MKADPMTTRRQFVQSLPAFAVAANMLDNDTAAVAPAAGHSWKTRVFAIPVGELSSQGAARARMEPHQVASFRQRHPAKVS